MTYLKKIFVTFSLVLSVLFSAHAFADNVVLINTFTVPAELEKETVQMWEKARDFLKDQPGYISTKLHRSVSNNARYMLINVAEWESVDAFKAAHQKMMQNKTVPLIDGVTGNPELYQVIRN